MLVKIPHIPRFAYSALVILALGCSDGDTAVEPRDYGPAVTCPNPREGAGQWELLPVRQDVPQIWYTASWTGQNVLLWGGRSQGYAPCDPICGLGAKFDPASKQWEPLPTENGPGARERAASAWTGNRWIVWGGYTYDGTTRDAPYVPRSDGAVYDPTTETWEEIPSVGAPQALREPQLAWTGSKLLVWGFTLPEGGGACEKAGGLYEPESKTWTLMNMEGAPRHCGQTLSWTGTEAIVWGSDADGEPTGGRYDPAANRWNPMNLDGAPIARAGNMAPWTGEDMLVFGGSAYRGGAETPPVTSGGLYNPTTDSWRIMTRSERPNHTMGVWSGSDLFMWGSQKCPTGASYNPKTNTWSAMAPTPDGLTPRDTNLIWAGDAMLVWGGWDHYGWYADGAIYHPN